MGQTQITPQLDLSGGLNLTNDILKTAPNEWISCQNAIVGRPGGSGTGNPSRGLAAISAPPVRIPTPGFTAFAYHGIIPQRLFIARADGTESWALTNFQFITPITQGNTCVGWTGLASASGSAILSFANPINISSAFQVSGWNLVTDLILFGGFSTSKITFFNSNSSNYAIYTYNTPIVGAATWVFSSTGGTFNPSAVTSIEINLTSDSGPVHDFDISDIRFENSNSRGYITNSLNFGQGINATAAGASLNNGTYQSVIVGCQDMYLIGIYPFSNWQKIITGLTETPILNSPIGTNFYFAQYPDPANPARNLAVLMSGNDIVYQFAPTQPAGNQLSQILAGSNEVQTLNFSDTPSGGNFTLTFNGQTTGSIAYNASASTIQSDLQGLSTIGTGNIIVTGAIPSLVFTFAGTLSNAKQNLITVTSSLTVSSGTVGLTFSYSAADPPVYNFANQIQTMTPNQVVTGGSFTLSFQGNTTVSIPYNAVDYTILQALQALPWSGGGNLGINAVNGTLSAGTPLQIILQPYMGGDSGTNPAPQITVGTDSLTGSMPVTGAITETTAGGIGPIYSYCWTYKNMLFLTGNALQPFSVAPSGIDAQTSFTAANIFIVKSSTSTKVTGGYDMDDYCIITTDTDVFLLFGSNPDSTTGDFDLKRSKSEVGCIEQAAGIRIGPGFYFYSGEDIYAFNGTESVSITGDKVTSLLDAIPVAQRRAVSLGYNKERNVLTVCFPQLVNGSTYFYTLTYDLRTHSWGEINNQAVGQQMCCSLQMPTDGTEQNPTFMQFGDGVNEWDPPAGTVSTLNRTCTVQHAFNHVGSPNVQKDFSRYILNTRWVSANGMTYLLGSDGKSYLTGPNGQYLTTNPFGVSSPNFTLTFYADEDPTTPLQTISNLVPVNGKIDVLLTGVSGDSISCAISSQTPTGDLDGVIYSGYIVYWDALEDL